jgi:hypothetical protein
VLTCSAKLIPPDLPQRTMSGRRAYKPPACACGVVSWRVLQRHWQDVEHDVPVWDVTAARWHALSPAAKDLLMGMLAYNTKHRLSAHQV